MSCIIIPVTFAYLVMITSGAGVCHQRTISRNAYTTYYTSLISQRYDTSCKLFGWGRCTRYRSVPQTRSQYHPALYALRPVCCSGYSGTAPSYCKPICSPRCMYGTCISPNRCSCKLNWTGRTCRDDLNLVNWCSSIRRNNIVNSYQSKVRSNLKVYCGTTVSNYKQYVNTEASYIAPKIRADSVRCPQNNYKTALYKLWMQHRFVRGYCCFTNSRYYVTLVTQLMRFENNFYDYVGCLTPMVAVELRKELTKHCSNDFSDAFCSIKAALDAIDVSSRLPPNKYQWTRETKKYKQAVLISFAILKKKYPKEYSSFSINVDNIIVDATNIILNYIQNKQVAELRKYATYLPSNSAYKATVSSCDNDRLCIFMKIVKQVRMYLHEASLDAVKINGKKRVVLNTAVGHREFLKQKQLDRILTVLSEQHSTSLRIANDLKKHTTSKFGELRSYFEKVETFNQQISSADIRYINGSLSNYKKRVNTIVGRLKGTMTSLLIHAFSAVALNIRDKTIRLAFKIAEAANLIAWLTGGINPNEILDAAAALANAIADSVKLSQVSVSFSRLRRTTRKIISKIQKNDDFLQDIHVMIMKKTYTRKQFEKSRTSFVEKYTAYNPQVTKPELTALGSTWGSLIDATCEVIENIDSETGAIVKGIVNGQGLCITARAQVDEMISLYEEIYDFQFDLIDAMAAYVRSSVSLDAAKEISTEFTKVTELDINSGSTLTTLAMMGGLTYVSFKAHILQAIHLYCNVLEYMNGGKPSAECKGVDTDLALLIANTIPTCQSQVTRFFEVPTKPSLTNKSMDYLNIDKLFAGNNVSFKIPSSQWLIDNEFIRPEEKSHSFFVKRFEIYLPVKTEYPQSFYVTANSVLHNEVTPGSTEYIIVPNNPLVYEYTMGPSRLLCHSHKFKNPYTSCETTDENEICEHTQDTKHHLYPSIYSQWSISIKGGDNMTVPNPATDLSVIIGMKLCKVASPTDYTVTMTATKSQENTDCCPKGHYRPTITSQCTKCPKKSQSALAGYFCEKI